MLCSHDVLSRLKIYTMIKWSIIEPWSHVFLYVVFFGFLSQSTLSWGVNTECLICRMNMANNSPCACGVAVVSFSRNNDPWSLEDRIFEEVKQASLIATHFWKNRTWCKCMAVLWDFPYLYSASCCVGVIQWLNFRPFFRAVLVSCLFCEYIFPWKMY